jgi:hypothetical protein
MASGKPVKFSNLSTEEKKAHLSTLRLKAEERNLSIRQEQVKKRNEAFQKEQEQLQKADALMRASRNANKLIEIEFSNKKPHVVIDYLFDNKQKFGFKENGMPTKEWLEKKFPLNQKQPTNKEIEWWKLRKNEEPADFFYRITVIFKTEDYDDIFNGLRASLQANYPHSSFDKAAIAEGVSFGTASLPYGAGGIPATTISKFINVEKNMMQQEKEKMKELYTNELFSEKLKQIKESGVIFPTQSRKAYRFGGARKNRNKRVTRKRKYN